MTYVEAAQAPLRKYAAFSGRSSRREFWAFVLAAAVVLGGLIGLAFVALLLADVVSDSTAGLAVFAVVAVLLLALYLMALVAVITPFLAVCVRRLHDTNRSGAWLLVALFVPFCAWIVLFFFATPGNPGTNEYGPNPDASSDDPMLPPSTEAEPM